MKIEPTSLVMSMETYLADDVPLRDFVLGFMKLRSDLISAERTGELEADRTPWMQWNSVVDLLFRACEDVVLPPDPDAIDDGDDEKSFPDTPMDERLVQFAIDEIEFRDRVLGILPAIRGFAASQLTIFPARLS